MGLHTIRSPHEPFVFHCDHMGLGSGTIGQHRALPRGIIIGANSYCRIRLAAIHCAGGNRIGWTGTCCRAVVRYHAQLLMSRVSRWLQQASGQTLVTWRRCKCGRRRKSTYMSQQPSTRHVTATKHRWVEAQRSVRPRTDGDPGDSPT